MAQTNADGSIIISTNIDTSGISNGITSIRNKFSALKDQKSTLSALTQGIKDQDYVIKQLNVEYANLVANGKANSSQAVELKRRIDTLTAEMKEMQAAATTLGAKATTAFTSMRTALMRFASYFIGVQTVFAAFRFSGDAAEFATKTEAGVVRIIDIYGEASSVVGDFIDQNSRALGLSKSSAATFAASYGNIFSSFSSQQENAKLTNEFLQMTSVIASKTGRTLDEVQEKIQSGLFGNLRAIDDLGIFVRQTALEASEAFKKIANGRSWEELSSEEQQQIRAFAILEQGVKKYGNEVLETSALTRAKFNAAYQDFKNSWGTIVNEVLLPVLQVLTRIFNIATVGLNALSGRSEKILGDSEEITEYSEETADNIEKQTDNQKALNKELKKSLAGFDDIQILSSQTADNTSSRLDSGLQGIGGDLGGTLDGSAYVDEVDETLTAIMGIAALALAAIGLILLFAGNIGLGIGFIISGAATLTVTMATASEYDYTGIIQMLTTIMGVAGGALLALGIILLWIGGVVGTPVAIGMIVAGGALIISAIAAQASFAPGDIEAWLSLILGIVGGALLAIGVILCMVGSIPMGVGMIIAGAVSLVAAVALNSDAVVEAIQGPIGIITAIVSAALLVLGIILVCSGAALPLGIGLIAAGAIGLATVVAINWNAIVEALQGPIGTITAIVSGALLVLGIILVCTGVGIPLGIALIAAGAVGLVTVTALNWDSIVDWVKGAWEAVKKFWNTYIAPIFTAKFWLDLAKKCGNGLISGFENAINGIIGLFEKMINWVVGGLNKISFDIPDWVPGIGGKTFGFNIPEVKFGRVSIPRLAQGAVIPPNREFLAVLGDQKQGTNIEAPLQTIVDAFNIALQQNGNVGGGNTEVVLEIDGREFGRAVVEQGNRENRRIGTRLVIA